jgi:hypothetical protein
MVPGQWSVRPSRLLGGGLFLVLIALPASTRGDIFIAIIGAVIVTLPLTIYVSIWRDN